VWAIHACLPLRYGVACGRCVEARPGRLAAIDWGYVISLLLLATAVFFYSWRSRGALAPRRVAGLRGVGSLWLTQNDLFCGFAGAAAVSPSLK
jgi:hypothetical protein